MSKEVLIQQLCDRKQNKHFLKFVMSSAGVLKNITASCVISVDVTFFRKIISDLKRANLCFSIVAQLQNRLILFLYRKDKMEQYFAQEKIHDYLKKYEYNYDDFMECLSQFLIRLQLYYEGKIEFPHEMGIFLQYPLEDVEAFIKNKGANFIMSGYWKVYTNPIYAVKMFRQLDIAKQHAIDEWYEGRAVYQIAE